MDEFFVAVGLIIGLVILAIPVAIVYLLVVVARLRRQVSDAAQTMSDLQVARDDAMRQIKALQRGDPVAEPVAEPETTDPPPAPKDIAAAAAAAETGARAAKAPEPVAAPPPAPAQPAGPSPLQRLFAWLAENWFYVVSAVSLALAGVFLVDYGMQNGLLPPPARVLAAGVFGAILIGAGEYIRRRWGDETEGATAYLPSVFSGAGIVTLFGGLLAARVLYDLIGPEMALVGLVGVALIALVLGWFHGPLLAAIGVIGAFGAPFVVGGASEDPSWLYGYFALIACLGLGIDTIRRWAWVSVLTLVCAFVAGPLIAIGAPNAVWAMIVYLAVLATAAVLIPARSLIPDQSGPLVAEVLRRRKAPWPAFPVLLALGALLVATGWLWLASGAGRAEFWMACAALGVLAGLLTVWSRTGPALQDLTAIPLAGFAAAVLWQGIDRGGVWRDFTRTYEGNPEAAFPWAATALVAMAAGLSYLAYWRSRQAGAYGAIWGGVAALCAPVVAVMLELSWTPATTLGAYPWALHGAALAGLATLLASIYARLDGPQDRLRASVAALAAIATMTFALTIVLEDDALTLALVATVIAAAALDRRFDLPALGLFISAGVVAVGYRLIMGAEMGAIAYRPWGSLLAVYGGSTVGFAVALWLSRARARPAAIVMLETGLWSALGLTVSLILFRAIDSAAPRYAGSHWVFGLYAMIWLTLMCAQLRRSDLGGWLRWARLGLAGVFALLGFGALIVAATILNPALDDWAGSGRVLGWPLVNTLAVAYLAPAGLLALAAWKLEALPHWLRLVFFGVAGALAAFWTFAVIRHFWQGSAAFELRYGMRQPELYTYTVVILLLGAVLFYQSLAKGQAMLRKAGLVVIGLAVAKVFLIDISGLQGLTRVFSLLILGLSLAGLAWLNRWAQGRGQTEAAPPA